MRPELLSPVGSMDAMYAAIEAGCDAIYIGGKKFGARAFSLNFTLDEIEYVVKYAHLYDVKVYVTVNTLIYDNEIDDCLDYLKSLHKIGVDAVIMQDLGMIDLTRKVLPNLEIHISTQAHIHNLDGVKILESLGIKRTVLARETSIDEIKHIKENSNIDLEIFVAGALCISYSGNCLMSSLIGGRSGNRGMCAGSCRLPYDLIDNKGNIVSKDKYLLSTKDLNTLEYIGDLIDLGVASFKIEGRMKSPEYVYVITRLYRKAIDSYLENGKVSIDNDELNNLKKVFNRGFTKGFLFNTKNNDLVNTERPNHMGVRIGKIINYNKGYADIKLEDTLSINDGIRVLGSTDTGMIVTSIYKNRNMVKEAYKGDVISIKLDDVKKDSIILKTKDSKLINEIDNIINSKQRKVLIDMVFNASIDSMSLEVKYKDIVVKLDGNKPSKAINRSMTKDDILKQISKLGDTPYKINKIDINLEDGLFINIKDINELRRNVIDELNRKRLEIKPYVEGIYSIDVPDFKKESNINYKVSNIEVYNKLKDYHNVYVDDLDLYNKIDNSIYILPRVLCEYDHYDRVEVSELGGLNQYKNVSTSPYMNAVNSYTVAFLHSLGASMVTLSYEMDYDRVENLIKHYHERYHKHPNLQVICYGYIEAMISKFNLLEYHGVSGEYYLLDRFKNKYPIRIRDNRMVIYYTNKVNLSENYFDIGVNNIRFDVDNINDLKDIKLIIKK